MINSSKRLLYVVNNPAFFVSHRLGVALAARDAGYDVHVATPDGDAVTQITQAGLTFHPLDFDRGGQNPLAELLTIINFFRLFRMVRPDLVHLVTIKPVIYGGIAARLARVPALVGAISGLGFTFIAKGLVARLRRALIVRLYRLACHHPNMVLIFQNEDDHKLFSQFRIMREADVTLIPGSGVDMTLYTPQAEPDGPPVISVATRLLGDKGVREFVDAARIVKQRHPAVRFILAGTPDPSNPETITEDELATWRAETVVELPGFVTDVATLYGQSHIVVLPSYREGMPKGLLEAAACGRAIVTTDVPGCRVTVDHDKTGLLVPVRTVEPLAAAMLRLIEEPETRRAMGVAGRARAERLFSLAHVITRHKEIYGALLNQ